MCWQPPPLGCWERGVLWLHPSIALTSGRDPHQHSQECWMSGSPSSAPPSPPPPAEMPQLNSAHILSLGPAELTGVIVLSLQRRQLCSENNLRLAIPMKPAGFSESKWKPGGVWRDPFGLKQSDTPDFNLNQEKKHGKYVTMKLIQQSLSSRPNHAN